MMVEAVQPRQIVKSEPWPCGRYEHAATYLPRLNAILIFGGSGGDGGLLLEDAWLFHLCKQS